MTKKEEKSQNVGKQVELETRWSSYAWMCKSQRENARNITKIGEKIAKCLENHENDGSCQKND